MTAGFPADEAQGLNVRRRSSYWHNSCELNARGAVASGDEMKTRRLRTFDVPAYSSEMVPRPSTWLDRWAVASIQSTVTSAPIRFMLWDGFSLPSTGSAVATILFKNRPALLSWVWDPDLNFGEAYMSGSVEVRGDLLGALEAIFRALTVQKSRPWWLWQQSNTAQTALENVHHHYDLGNDFYRLWLDRDMVYTCAYFPTPDATLEGSRSVRTHSRAAGVVSA